MRSASYKRVFVAILMMTFIGQSIASTRMACQYQVPQSAFQEQMMSSVGMDHSQHAVIKSADSENSATCCTDCDCALGGCGTAALPVSLQAFDVQQSSFNIRYATTTDVQLATSLFRPPIAR